MAKRIEYKAFVKCGYWKQKEGKWQGICMGWDTNLAKVKRELEAHLKQWDGRPVCTAREHTSAETAKTLMVTDWKIKCREVEDLENVLEGHRDAPTINEADDPKDDWMLI